MEMYRPTYAEINLDHLEHNIRAIQSALPQAPFLCPMVKANGYGHGDVIFARFLEKLQVRHLGVCLIEEGLRLRRAGVKAEVLVFRGFDREGAQALIENEMTPVVSDWEHLDHLEAVANKVVEIHLKFDTGMNRLGFRPEEAQKLYDRLWQNKKIRVKALATHLLHGEDALREDGLTSEQLRKFDRVAKIFKPFNLFVHALNSSGILNLIAYQRQGPASSSSHPLALQNWGLRPGLMIYGYNPTSDQSILPLKPVMSVRSRAIFLRRLQAGETVSYSGTWKAQRNSVIAVIPIGYADGYHRALSNKAHALFMGQRVPVVGTVCMDYLMVDITQMVGDQDFEKFKDQEVTLFGQDSQGNFLSAEELSRQAHSITWEMLTSVSERVPRSFIGRGFELLRSEVEGLA